MVLTICVTTKISRSSTQSSHFREPIVCPFYTYNNKTFDQFLLREPVLLGRNNLEASFSKHLRIFWPFREKATACLVQILRSAAHALFLFGGQIAVKNVAIKEVGLLGNRVTVDRLDKRIFCCPVSPGGIGPSRENR